MFVLKEKNTNHAFALIENDGEKPWFEKVMLWAEIVDVNSVGSINFSTSKGTISAVLFQPTGTSFSKDSLYMITNYPEEITLIEAYNIINKD